MLDPMVKKAFLAGWAYGRDSDAIPEEEALVLYERGLWEDFKKGKPTWES